MTTMFAGGYSWLTALRRRMQAPEWLWLVLSCMTCAGLLLAAGVPWAMAVTLGFILGLQAGALTIVLMRMLQHWVVAPVGLHDLPRRTWLLVVLGMTVSALGFGTLSSLPMWLVLLLTVHMLLAGLVFTWKPGPRSD